jgi:hypothetical protein
MKKYNLTRAAAVVFGAALFLFLTVGAKAQTLTHRYSFDDSAGSTNFADSVGGPAWDGVLISDGGAPVLTGSSLELFGDGGYAALPPEIITNYSQLTVEFWIDVGTNNQAWTRIFAFGSQNGAFNKNSGVDYCSYAGGNYQNLDDLSTNNVDAYANNPAGLNGETNVHVTVVVDPVNNNMYYYNGVQVVSTLHGTVTPLSEMMDTYDLIGRSLYNGDPPLSATYHEFRIYSGVLSPQAVVLNDAAGPGTYITSPGAPVSLNFSSPANPLLVNQIAPQNLLGNFASVTNLNLIAYGGATFSTGNGSILTINNNGVVTAVAPGTTTVVASYGGLSETNTLTVVALPTTLTHRYSFASGTNDLIGNANATLIGDAAITGGQLVLPGGPNGSGYVSLPGNLINISTNAAVTFETWVTIGETAEWSHLFEFGAIKANNVYCAPMADAGGFHEFGLSEGFSGGQTLSWAHGWSNITLHYTGVMDPTTLTLAVYTNGVLMQTTFTDGAPLTDLATNNATIGNSSYGDPDATFNMQEFRIYSGALTPAQVAMTDLNGPNSTSFDPGALASVTVVPTNYPAFSSYVAPVILANYANLTNFNLLPNSFASETGLTVTSSDPSIVSVNSQNLLTTYRPGTVKLSATYQGKSSSATVQVANQAVLTHRYSFTIDASDSVGGADGVLMGSATISNEQVVLNTPANPGDNTTYVSMPDGLISNYDGVTIDMWATISPLQQHWSRIWEFADVGPATANELYFAPAWNPTPNQTFFSFDPPDGGLNLGEAPPMTNQTVHLTTVLGDGSVDIYTNAVLYLSFSGYVAPGSQAGTSGNWIGYSPYGDPGITGSVDEYRIYQGRLSPEEVMASDALGPNVVLSTTNASLSASAMNGSTVLSWPAANAGFAVQSSGNLSSPGLWTTLTNGPTLVGTQWQLTVTNSGSSQFYRLIR